MAKAQKITMKSPKGVAVYPRINRPDTKFDELGKYKADIAVDADDAAPLIKKLQEIHKEHVGRAAPKSGNSMFAPEVDKETGDETGRIIFKFRVANKELKDGTLWDRQPKVFDAKGNRIEPDDLPNIGGGSTLKVFFEVYRWTSGNKPGVSLQPLKVQLIDLVEFTGGDDESPFEEEDGFTIDDDEDDDTFSDEEEQDDPDF